MQAHYLLFTIHYKKKTLKFRCVRLKLVDFKSNFLSELDLNPFLLLFYINTAIVAVACGFPTEIRKKEEVNKME